MLGRAVPFFATNTGLAMPAIARQRYLPSPDGQLSLMNVADSTGASPLKVILNFDPAARR